MRITVLSRVPGRISTEPGFVASSCCNPSRKPLIFALSLSNRTLSRNWRVVLLLDRPARKHANSSACFNFSNRHKCRARLIVIVPLCRASTNCWSAFLRISFTLPTLRAQTPEISNLLPHVDLLRWLANLPNPCACPLRFGWHEPLIGNMIPVRALTQPE